MKNITDLAETLCSAMGLNPDLGSMAIEYLTENDMLPGGDARAEPEHAAKLLIVLIGSAEMYAPHKLIERYWHLPFSYIQSVKQTPYGSHDFSIENPADPDAAVAIENARTIGETFGEALCAFITEYAYADAIADKLLSVSLACGPGMSTAFISQTTHGCQPIDMGVVSWSLNYTLNDFGPGLPDDAPRARLERYASAPGEIFQVLREELTGRDSPPDAFLSMDDKPIVGKSCPTIERG